MADHGASLRGIVANPNDDRPVLFKKGVVLFTLIPAVDTQ
jgi:hypothetical protein